MSFPRPGLLPTASQHYVQHNNTGEGEATIQRRSLAVDSLFDWSVLDPSTCIVLGLRWRTRKCPLRLVRSGQAGQDWLVAGFGMVSGDVAMWCRCLLWLCGFSLLLRSQV